MKINNIKRNKNNIRPKQTVNIRNCRLGKNNVV